VRSNSKKEKFNVTLMCLFTMLLIIQMSLCSVTPRAVHIKHVSSLVFQ